MLFSYAGGAGGSIYISCSNMGSQCLFSLGGSNKLGSLLAFPKAEFNTGSVGSYGPHVATQCTHLVWHEANSSSIQRHWDPNAWGKFTNSKRFDLLPGQEKLVLTVKLFDQLGSLVRGTSDVIELRVCLTSTICSTSATIIPPTYYAFDPQNGESHFEAEIECPLSVQRARFEIHVVGKELSPLMGTINCSLCKRGQTMVRRTLGQEIIYRCDRCPPNHYIIDQFGKSSCLPVVKFSNAILDRCTRNWSPSVYAGTKLVDMLFMSRALFESSQRCDVARWC